LVEMMQKMITNSKLVVVEDYHCHTLDGATIFQSWFK